MRKRAVLDSSVEQDMLVPHLAGYPSHGGRFSGIIPSSVSGRHGAEHGHGTSSSHGRRMFQDIEMAVTAQENRGMEENSAHALCHDM